MVNVISKRGLKELTAKHPTTEIEALKWYKAAIHAKWDSFPDVRKMFPTADKIGEVVVFNLLGNHFRLITTIYFPAQEIYVKALLTHKEYDRKEWTKWC